MPSAASEPITFAQLDPSAHAPWVRTTVTSLDDIAVLLRGSRLVTFLIDIRRLLSHEHNLSTAIKAVIYGTRSRMGDGIGRQRPEQEMRWTNALPRYSSATRSDWISSIQSRRRSIRRSTGSMTATAC